MSVYLPVAADTPRLSIPSSFFLLNTRNLEGRLFLLSDMFEFIRSDKNGLTRKTIDTRILDHGQCCLPKLAGGFALPITPTRTIMVSR